MRAMAAAAAIQMRVRPLLPRRIVPEVVVPLVHGDGAWGHGLPAGGGWPGVSGLPPAGA